MRMLTETKICLSCNSQIKGRTDKKFCDDHCRSAFNNQRNGTDTNFMRNINHALRRNRRILGELLPAAATTVKTQMDQLQYRGFHFKYFTHIHRNKKGETFYYCYDHGYLPLADNRLLIVRQKREESDVTNAI